MCGLHLFNIFCKGCDGCLNWEGMYDPMPNVFNTEHFTVKPINKTNNQLLDRVSEQLEKIYKSIDWPYVKPSLQVRFVFYTNISFGYYPHEVK